MVTRQNVFTLFDYVREEIRKKFKKYFRWKILHDKNKKQIRDIILLRVEKKNDFFNFMQRGSYED